MKKFSTGFKLYPPDGSRPDWLKIRVRQDGLAQETENRVHTHGLHTVCESAACPNIGRCWRCGRATIMILGDQCTRRCRFCNVSKGRVAAPDPGEPQRVAEAVRQSGLSEVVITSVTRDDLSDGGAGHWAATVRAIHSIAPNCLVEVLTPDFAGSLSSLDAVLASTPEVFGHNVETVPRLYPAIRPEADYRRSLSVLRRAAERGFVTKTSLMLGLGEEDSEIYETLCEIRAVGVEILFMGQYLRPTAAHVSPAGFLSPEHFAALGQLALSLGFGCVVSAPLVRSSYHDDSQAAYLRHRLCKK